jgi:transposase-like protein
MSHRTFTPEFKRKVVEDHLHGGRTVAEICREYQLSRNVFNRWRDQYLSPAPAPPPVEDAPRQLREAEQRIAELESALGRTAMELDFMRRCFKRAGLPFPKLPKA